MKKFKKFPIGISSFKNLIEGEFLYADKTLLAKDIMDDSSQVVVITRPRRFGKTLNLSMLYYFLGQNNSDHKNLFEGLNISEDAQFCKQHQQQYPAIFITFKDVKKLNFPAAYATITTLISDLYAEHRYLLEGNALEQNEKNIFEALLNGEASQNHIEASIKKLSEYMERKFNKAPIILIDEYDTPIQQAYLENYYNPMIDLMRSILGQALKDNDAFQKAIVTGITRIAQESLFSGVNNITVYSVLQPEYGQYFGFTEEEVRTLLAQSKQTASIESIKEWYNGYVVGEYTLYNPWSIINCLDNNNKLQSYWVNTSSNELIAKLLSLAKPSVKQQFEELLQGNVIEQPISENLVFAELTKRDEALWSLLLYAGYLKVLSSELHDYDLIAKLAIPNKEVGFVYDQIISGWFYEAINRDAYLRFVRSLENGEVNKFKEYLSDYIMQSGSYFEFNNDTSEKVFHAFILGLVVGLRAQYYIHSNQESGFGRFDVLFIPKDKTKNGIILEFKVSQDPSLILNKAEEALTQIKDKQYIERFRQYNISSVLAIGLAFCGKQVQLAHEIILVNG